MTVSDKKLGQDQNSDNRAESYQAQVKSAQDYYPFGWTMPGRQLVSTNYRYGFNGKENDKEWGTQLIQDYGFRIYNPAVGKFLSVDPLTNSYPFFTPYQFAGNDPIRSIDLDGLEGMDVKNLTQGSSGQWYAKLGVKRATGELRFYNSKGFMIDPNTKAHATMAKGFKAGGWETDGKQVYNSNVKYGNSDGFRKSLDVFATNPEGHKSFNIIVPVDVSDINTIYMPEVEPIAVGKVLLEVAMPKENVELLPPPPAPAPPPPTIRTVPPPSTVLPPSTTTVSPTSDPQAIASGLCWWCYMGYTNKHRAEGIAATRAWLEANPSFNIEITVSAGHTGNYIYSEKWSDEITGTKPYELGGRHYDQIGVGETYESRLNNVHKLFQDAVGKAYKDRLIVKKGTANVKVQSIKMEAVPKS